MLSLQDLSNERTHSQELSAEVQRLREKLQKVEAELAITSKALSQSEERTDSLSKLLNQSHFCLENNNGGAVVALANSDFSSTAHVCQSGSQESRVDQTPEAGEGRDFSIINEGDEGETEEQLRKRLAALEREVRE